MNSEHSYTGLSLRTDDGRQITAIKQEFGYRIKVESPDKEILVKEKQQAFESKYELDLFDDINDQERAEDKKIDDEYRRRIRSGVMLQYTVESTKKSSST